jgi:hypothetical protein
MVYREMEIGGFIVMVISVVLVFRVEHIVGKQLPDSQGMVV